MLQQLMKNAQRQDTNQLQSSDGLQSHIMTAEKKVLHWAKEIKFGETDGTTLNYNVRILGQKRSDRVKCSGVNAPVARRKTKH